MLDRLTLDRIRGMAEDVAQRESCRLYDLEFTGSGAGRTLRVFIDKPGSESVSIDDCSNVSHGLNLLLDVEDLIPGGAYHLEVSSPGLERKLRQPWHFETAVGEKVFLRSRGFFEEYGEGLPPGVGRRKQTQAVIEGVRDNKVLLTADGVSFQVPLEEIEKAHVVFEFEEPVAPGLKAQQRKGPPRGKGQKKR